MKWTPPSLVAETSRLLWRFCSPFSVNRSAETSRRKFSTIWRRRSFSSCGGPQCAGSGQFGESPESTMEKTIEKWDLSMENWSKIGIYWKWGHQKWGSNQLCGSFSKNLGEQTGGLSMENWWEMRFNHGKCRGCQENTSNQWTMYILFSWDRKQPWVLNPNYRGFP